MLPLWLYTLGSTLMADADLKIEFTKLLMNLSIVVLPSFIGYGISLRWPSVKQSVLRVVKPASLALIVFFLSLVVYTKWYTFQLMKWYFFLGGS